MKHVFLSMLDAAGTRIEFKDLNGVWTTMMIGPLAHYAKRTVKLVVKARASVVFEAYMCPKAMVQKAGDEFILKLYTNRPHQCVMSLPFKALRAARPVKGFVSNPVPPMPWSFPGHDGAGQRK